jgi:hypothetical protein
VKRNGFAMTLTLWLIVGGLMVSGFGLLWYGYTSRGEKIELLTVDRDGWKVLAESRAETVSRLTTANESNVASVRELSAKLSEAIGQANAADAAAARAIASQRQAERAARIAMDTLRHERERAYAQDECREWAEAAVCGPVADGLRRQWSGQGHGGDGSGAGAGGSAAVRPATPGAG